MASAAARVLASFIVLCRGARVSPGLTARSLSPPRSRLDEPCKADGTRPQRRRSQWCEQEGIIDQISLQQIEAGNGLCLDGQCYDKNSLHKWLLQSETLPHNRAYLSLSTMRCLSEGGPPAIAQDPLTVVNTAAMVLAVAFGSQGRLLTGEISGEVKLWSVETGEWLRDFVGHSTSVLSVCFSPDGSKVLTASRDLTLRLWDAETGAELRRFSGHTKCVNQALFSPNGSMILSGSDDGSVRFWSIGTGKMVLRLLVMRPILSLAFRPPDGREAFVGLGGAAVLWDLWTGHMRKAYGDQDSVQDVHTVAYSNDGGRLLTCNSDTPMIWDADAGAVLRELKGNCSFFCPSAMSPDGRRVMTAAYDFTHARLWDVATGGELERFCDAEQEDVFATAFSPDGQQVVIVSDLRARIFNISV